QKNAFLDFALLEGWVTHANPPEPLLFAGAHRRLHIVGNSLFKSSHTAAHPLSGRGLSRKDATGRPAGGWRAAVRCRACSRATGASNGASRRRPFFAYVLGSASRRIHGAAAR